MLAGRIVGGNAVSIASFPWVASLRSWGAHRCGSAIISPNRILTAAHCTIGGTNTGFEVRAGSTHRESGGQLIGSERVINHPRFSLATIEHDICVIWLSSAFNLSPDSIAVAPLHDVRFNLAAGTMVVVENIFEIFGHKINLCLKSRKGNCCWLGSHL